MDGNSSTLPACKGIKNDPKTKRLSKPSRNMKFHNENLENIRNLSRHDDVNESILSLGVERINNNNEKIVWEDYNLIELTIEPPLQFQDNTPKKRKINCIEKFAVKLVSDLIKEALTLSSQITWSILCSRECHMSEKVELKNNMGSWVGARLCWTPEMHTYSPCHSNRPGSRISLTSSRLSSSHNSLSVLTANKVDDSSFITSAMSHDVLITNGNISDMYNVPFDSDIYAVPVDVVKKVPKPPVRCKKLKHKGQHLCDSSKLYSVPVTTSKVSSSQQCQSLKQRSLKQITNNVSGNKHSTLSTQKQRSASADSTNNEPIHMTLQEVRQYLHTLYSSSSDSSESRKRAKTYRTSCDLTLNSNYQNNNYNATVYSRKNKRNTFSLYKNRKIKLSEEESINCLQNEDKMKKIFGNNFSTNIKKTLCNIFHFKRLPTTEHCLGKREVILHSDEIGVRLSGHTDRNPPSPITKPPFSKRALPPLPKTDGLLNNKELTECDNKLNEPVEVEEQSLDFTSSIQKVKDYGWYWGPISGEAAERILSSEPDGSFIVRDSSDDYYIFSLTFKLNSIVRHVRIEHDQGNFSFGSSTRFKSHTIVDFIESAVEHSLSGRYLFFLHRRPVLGPMRVQLLHPVSRFKHVQSLQHKCRFVILKLVRRDLIPELPLPRRLVEYLSTPHYYTEESLVEDERPDSTIAAATGSSMVQEQNHS